MAYAVNSELLIYFNICYFLKITSRILFNEIDITLKNTINNPSQPRSTAIDNKLEPKSPCSKFCI